MRTGKSQTKGPTFQWKMRLAFCSISSGSSVTVYQCTGLQVSKNITVYRCHKYHLFDLILYVPSKIFQLNREGSSWVEHVLSWDKCVLLKYHNAVTPVRLEPMAPPVGVKHSTTEPLPSLHKYHNYIVCHRLALIFI